MVKYTATDGTQFDDRNEWRKYEFETNYTFKNKAGERLLKVPGNIQGQPFDLADLDSCEVMLLDHSDQVQVDNLTNCHVFVGPCSGSVFIRNCSNCIFTVACKQLRTRDCQQCDFFLYSLTDPIIETSQGMRFAPFNGAYHGLRSHFLAASLEPENNHWSQVYDFNDPNKTGENWTIIAPDEVTQDWVIPLNEIIPEAENIGACENPVPKNANAFSNDSNDSEMKSFSITTSQDDANKLMNAMSIHSGPLDGLTLQKEKGTTNEISTKQNPISPTSTIEYWPVLEEFEKKFTNKIEEKRKQEENLIKEVQKKAADDLDKFYGNRTDKLATRAATNREQEEAKIKNQTALKEAAREKPWSRVVDLVDFSTNLGATKKIEQKKDDKKSPIQNNEQPKTKNQEKSNIEKYDTDVSRMKSILLVLKNTGGITK